MKYPYFIAGSSYSPVCLVPLSPINQFNFNISACCEMCLLTALFHSGMVDSLGRLCLVVSVGDTPTLPDSLPRLDVWHFILWQREGDSLTANDLLDIIHDDSVDHVLPKAYWWYYIPLQVAIIWKSEVVISTLITNIRLLIWHLFRISIFDKKNGDIVTLLMLQLLFKDIVPCADEQRKLASLHAKIH